MKQVEKFRNIERIRQQLRDARRAAAARRAEAARSSVQNAPPGAAPPDARPRP